VLMAWVIPTALLTFWTIKKTIGLRASRKEELQGLDMPEHGMEAYPEDSGEVAPGVGVSGVTHMKADDR
jgi:ammonia channel protein AmtB